MAYFKDQQGGLHFLTAEDIANGWKARLPDDSEAISDAEAAALQAPTLEQAQAAQASVLAMAYQAAIAQPVTFTSAGGVTQSFQADPASVSNLSYMRSAYPTADVLPAGFYWKAADNSKVPFTVADMAGLAKVMGDQGFSAFDHLDGKKRGIAAAVTVAAVQAITW